MRDVTHYPTYLSRYDRLSVWKATLGLVSFKCILSYLPTSRFYHDYVTDTSRLRPFLKLYCEVVLRQIIPIPTTLINSQTNMIATRKSKRKCDTVSEPPTACSQNKQVHEMNQLKSEWSGRTSRNLSDPGTLWWHCTAHSPSHFDYNVIQRLIIAVITSSTSIYII